MNEWTEWCAVPFGCNDTYFFIFSNDCLFAECCSVLPDYWRTSDINELSTYDRTQEAVVYVIYPRCYAAEWSNPKAITYTTASEGSM